MKKLTGAFIFALAALFSSVINAAGNPHVLMETNMGSFTIELNPQAAPKTVENFIGYVNDGYYNGTLFHRVIKDFMIQGGGFTEGLRKKETKDPIKNEARNGLKNVRGTIAMARTGDPHSATAQFFINTVDNAFLDHTAPNSRGWGYAVFGKVVRGMDVVDKIQSVQTKAQGMYRDVPAADIIIKKATVVK